MIVLDRGIFLREGSSRGKIPRSKTITDEFTQWPKQLQRKWCKVIILVTIPFWGSYYHLFQHFCLKIQNWVSKNKKTKTKKRPLFSDILSRSEKGKQAFFSFRPTCNHCIISVPISFKFMKKIYVSFLFFFFFFTFHFTVFSFVTLAKELLPLANVKNMLPENLSQNPLEENISKIRGACQPTVERHGDLTLNILLRGNCVRSHWKETVSDSLVPLKWIQLCQSQRNNQKRVAILVNHKLPDVELVGSVHCDFIIEIIRISVEDNTN